PYRPRLIAAANRAGTWLARAGLEHEPLRAEALMERAQREAGLRAFGDMGFLAPLRVLLQSVGREARLHPVGRWITRRRLVSALKTRLRAEALVREHPEIQERPVASPIVIAGLQRTGTTMLHRLLAQDPCLRALRSWEALDPVPPR